MHVIVYYHCDQWQTRSTFHIQGVYKNTARGRKKLLKDILSDKDIEYDENDREQIEWRILHAYPSAVNDLITYGCAHAYEAFG